MKKWKHFKTIFKHRWQVIRNATHVGLFFHCLRHDLSKYSPTEFLTSAKYYQGTSSPVFKERELNNQFSEIALHHLRRNKHHWEYWVDFYRGQIVIKTMPYKYALESVIDILAASKTYQGKSAKDFDGKEAVKYYEERSKKYFVTRATKEFILICLKRFAKDGWKHLKKKDTKLLYAQLTSCLPDVEVMKDIL